jgi:hypothetical protein
MHCSTIFEPRHPFNPPETSSDSLCFRQNTAHMYQESRYGTLVYLDAVFHSVFRTSLRFFQAAFTCCSCAVLGGELLYRYVLRYSVLHSSTWQHISLENCPHKVVPKPRAPPNPVFIHPSWMPCLASCSLIELAQITYFTQIALIQLDSKIMIPLPRAVMQKD